MPSEPAIDESLLNAQIAQDVTTQALPTLNRWLNVNRRQPNRRVRGFIQLPSFDIPSAGRTYSEIVGVFNYTSPNNVVLKDFRNIKNNGTYTLCVAYANSDYTVKRYVLAKGNHDRNLSYPPNYNGEIIKKNFRLEVWDGIDGVDATENGMKFNTSVLSTTVDMRSGSDFELAAPSMVCESQNVLNELQFYVTPPSAVAYPLRVWLENHAEQQFVTLSSGTKVFSWQGNGFGDITYISSVGAKQPDFFADVVPGTKYKLQFLGNQQLGGTHNSNMGQVFIAVTPNIGGNNTHVVFNLAEKSGPNFLTLSNDGVSKFIINFSGTTATLDYSHLPAGQVIVIEIDLLSQTAFLWDGYTGILKSVVQPALQFLMDEFGNFITDEFGNKIQVIL